jgi:hypothetical protein
VLTDIWENEIPKQALCMYGPQQQRIHYWSINYFLLGSGIKNVMSNEILCEGDFM